MAAEQVTGGFVVCSLALPNHTIAEVRMLSQEQSIMALYTAQQSSCLAAATTTIPTGKARYAPHSQPARLRYDPGVEHMW